MITPETATPAASDSPATVTACILARDEAARIGDALESLAGWCDRIIVLDNGSTDATADIARAKGALVVPAPPPEDGGNFDGLRNLAVPHMAGDWLFVLDADERVPPRLGPVLRDLIARRGGEFEALLLPFRHHFCGRWMRHCGWWPGYTRPQLLKKGRFRYNGRLHGGVAVDGRVLRFPADDPDLAIVHYSYDDLPHYLAKLNRYTDAEAENLLRDGGDHGWQAQVAAFVHDWQVYYEGGRAYGDGTHGFVLSFLSATYRLLSRAKLWDLRRRRGELSASTAAPDAVPGSVPEILEFMARVVQEGAEPWLRPAYPPAPERGAYVPADWLADDPVGPLAEGLVPAPDAPEAADFPDVTAVVLARNEAGRIEKALRSLRGWCRQVVVVDNESGDGTAQIAARHADLVLTAPRADFSDNFEGARNLALERAAGEWVFFLDADERVPRPLAETLLRLVRERGGEFDALEIPSRNVVCGKWLSSPAWWPGYKTPYLVRRGAGVYGDRLHSGVRLAPGARVVRLPADDPARAVVHESVPDVAAFVEKLDRYTTAEAKNLLADGTAAHGWRAQMAHFTEDWCVHYDRLRAREDGMHGFVFAFLCALYRFLTRAKLWDLRRQAGADADEALPESLREILEFMARVTAEGAAPHLAADASAPPAPETPRLPLVWMSPFFDPSGYADEARNFVLALVESGQEVAVSPMTWSPLDAGLPPAVREALRSRTVPWDAPAAVFVSQATPPLHRPSPGALVSVARTMFETDRLNPEWVPVLNRMDRVWVPSAFNRDTFAASGVSPEKIAVVPGAIDPVPFADPDAEPWPGVPGAEPFRFLAVFDWSLHKGWDVLLEAFAREFAPDEGVGLVVKTWSSLGYGPGDLRAQADAHLVGALGRTLADLPHVRLWEERVLQADLPRVYRAVQAFVAPTRGEGWCRPLMEAMAAGLPCVATAWSGLTEFFDGRVGYPVKYRLAPVSDAGAREIEIYAGHRWADPDVADLRRQMRRAYEERDGNARRKGRAAGRRIAERFSRAAVAQILREELARCARLAGERAGERVDAPAGAREQRAEAEPGAGRPSPDGGPRPRRPDPAALPRSNPVPADPVPATDLAAPLSRPVRLRFEGDLFRRTSLSHANRELCDALLRLSETAVPQEPRGAGRSGADLEIQYRPFTLDAEAVLPHLPPGEADRFARLRALVPAGPPGSGAPPPDVTIRHHWPPDWRRPPAGKLVVIQPWELSHLPRHDWIAGAAREADAVWAYSRFVRDVYVRSGVPAEKVRVVPLGVRTDVFALEGEAYPLPTGKAFRFLFVGGTIERKGADLLLAAYRRAFGPGDDVCLVVKDMGTRTFYRGATMGDAFRRAAADPSGPEVLYLEEDLGETELAALYRACHAVVLPYRGEGFGLAPLEGMACGLLPIVTSGGPTDDYADDRFALRLPHRRRTRPGLYRGVDHVAVDPWEIEPDGEALVAALRWAYENPDAARERGRLARAHAEAGWTWERAAAVARRELAALFAAPLPDGERAAAPAAVPAGRPGGGRPPALPSRKKAGGDRVSLCLIARDEEPRIGACLESVRPWVDEMVVVDTGSSDRTPEIARDHGARVFRLPWPDSFAAARNASLDQARGEWIFWMDADDVISPEAGALLRELTASRPDRDAAFQARVRIPPGPGEYGESVVDHVKLFPNRPDLRFEHRIHEQILPALRRAGLPVLFSDLYVTHRHYDRSPEGQAKKRLRDFRLLESDLRDRPGHPFVLFNLGMTHLYATREYEAAAQYLERCLAASHPRDSIVRKAFALLATARTCQEEWEAALAANEAGRRHYPDDPELLFQAGQLYQRAGDFSAARRALERLVGAAGAAPGGDAAGEPHYRSVDAGLGTYRGWHELALLYRRMGDPEHCARTLRRVLSAHPGYAPARADLEETEALLRARPRPGGAV